MSIINKSLYPGIVVFLLFAFGCSNHQIQVSESKLNSIKLGDSKDAVEAVLGKPIEIDRYDFKGRKEEAWTYSNSPTASTNQQVIFDVEKGVVVKVIHKE